jgi:hypothetical protein
MITWGDAELWRGVQRMQLAGRLMPTPVVGNKGDSFNSGQLRDTVLQF